MNKILVVTDKLYPDEVGGSCTYAYETIIKSEVKVIVDIFTCYPEKKQNNSFFKGNVYREFNKKNPIMSSYKLACLINTNNYDKIVFHSIYSWLIYYIIKIFIKNKPLQVAIFHGPWHKEAKLKYKSKNEKLKELVIVPLMKLITFKYAKDNERFIFLSEYMKNELIDINNIVKNKSTKIIPGGVNLSNYERKFTKEEAKRMLGIDKDRFVIFTLRRLEYRMGIQNAIKAVEILNTNNSQENVMIIGGKGNYSDQLKKMATEACGEFIFTGFIPDEKINLYFCASDLFLVPSVDLEGFGLVNLESLAMGVPVLATPQGGMIELAKAFQNFYISKENTPESLAVKITEIKNDILNNVINEKEILEYSWEKITDCLLNYIITGV